MSAIRRIVILAIFVLAASRPAGARVLYGAGPLPNNDPSLGEPSYLFRIDPTTAEVAQICTIGFSYVRAMDVDPLTGVMYATAWRPTLEIHGEFVLLTL